MNSTKILVLYEQSSVIQSDFCSIFHKYAISRNTEFRALLSKSFKQKDLHWSDVIVFVRSQNPLELSIIKWAKRNGRFCIVYWDDDLTNPPKGYVLPKIRYQSMISVLNTVDLVLSPNPNLAKKLAKYNKNNRYAQFDTIVEPQSILIPSKKEKEKLKILYAASASRTSDFDELVKPVIVKLYRYYGDVFSLTFIGAKPNFANYKETIDLRYIDIMPLTEYRKHMSDVHYDIGLAPLIETEFSKYKYYNKFIEYSTNGIPGVYSNCEPYNLIVENYHNGLLCNNTIDGWYNALKQMIESSELRNRCTDNAITTLKEKFSSAGVYTSINLQIPEITSYRSIKGKHYCLLLAKFLNLWFKIIYLPFAYLFAEGFQKMFARGKAHMYFSHLND